jgi:hypothetical protein
MGSYYRGKQIGAEIFVLDTNPFCTLERALSGTVLHFENQWFPVLEKQPSKVTHPACKLMLIETSAPAEAQER